LLLPPPRRLDNLMGVHLAEVAASAPRHWSRPGGTRLKTAAILGSGAACLALALAGLETRYALALICGVAALVAMLALGKLSRMRAAMIGAVVFGLSIGLSITFLLHTSVVGSYVPFDGGAEGVTLSLTLCGCIGYIFVDLMDGARRPWTVSHLLFWPPVLFMVAGLISMLNAIEPYLSLLEEIRLASLLLITVVVMNLSGQEPRLYLRALAASVILQAGIVAVQSATGQGLGLTVFGEASPIPFSIDYQTIFRPTGTLGDPNITAYFFEITGPLVLAMGFAVRGRIERLLFFAAALAALAAVILTLSRAAWVALPLACLIVIVAYFGRRLLSVRSLLFACGGASVTAVIVGVAWPTIAMRLFGDDAGSLAQRVPLIEAAWSVLTQHPIVGVGLNNFAIAFERLDQTGYARVFQHVDLVVHNLHLLVWTEVGTLGLLTYIWYFGSAFLAAFMLRHAEPWVRAAAIGIAAGLFAHLLHGFVDPGFKLSLTISQLIAAQIGLLGSLLLRQRRFRFEAQVRAQG